MGENYLQKYFAYFNNSEDEDDIDKNDIFVNIILILNVL